MRPIVFICFIFLTSFGYTQNYSITIEGTVYLDSIPTEAAHIIIESDTVSFSGISESMGKFKFSAINIPSNKVKVTASYFGYSTDEKIIDLTPGKQSYNLPIYLKSRPEELKEVFVEGSTTYKRSINKLTYKVRQRDFIKNTKGTTVMNSVPNLSYSEVDGIKIEGVREAKIFIDGIEGTLSDLQAMVVSEIDNIEVIYNPSARYGSEFSGGVINIKLKENGKTFYKAGFEVKKGLLLESTFLIPQLTIKTNKLLIKSYFNYISSFQEVNFDLERNDESGSLYRQNSYREPHVVQKSGKFQVRYSPSELDKFYLNYNYNSNRVAGDFVGTYSSMNSEPKEFINNTGNSFEQFDLNGIYERKINENTLYLKSRYLDYSKNSYFHFLEQNITSEKTEVGSGIEELTAEVLYEMPGSSLFNKEFDLVWNAKVISRNYGFMQSDFFLDQQIWSINLDLNHAVNDKITLALSPYFEWVNNELPDSNNSNQINFLPTASFNYSISEKGNLELSYARRIHRPNSYDLNDESIFLNPGTATKGNEALQPEVRDNYSIRFFQSLKNRSYFTIRTNYSSTRDAILEDIENQGNLLIYTKNNIGNAETTGMSLSYGGSFFGIFRANLTTGLNYFHFDNQEYINSGFSFNSNIFLSGNFFKDKLNLSFYGSYQNPSYDFISTTYKNPYTELSLGTNFLKDKLSCTLVYSDLFNWGAPKRIEINRNNISQITKIQSRISNISVILAYRFGKNFNDRYDNKALKNNDINFEE